MKIILMVLSLMILVPVAGWGEPQTNSSVEERLQTLEREQQDLADKFSEYQTEPYHTLEGKKAAGLGTMIADRLSLSGLLELEGYFESVKDRDGNSDSQSDLTLATAQLSFGVLISEMVSGDVSLLYEEDETDLEVDEAAINLEYNGWFGRLGQQYVPFSPFYSHMISDPMTLELGETRETAVLGGYRTNLVAVELFVFNGDAEEEGGEDHINDYGVHLTVYPTPGLEVGVGYLSDLADSDAELLENEEYQSRTGGASAYFVWEFSDYGLSAEYVGATEDFDAEDLDMNGDGSGDRPMAWNTEFAWYPQSFLEFAVRVEGSDEYYDQPELQYGAKVGWSPMEHLSLALEYLHGEFDKDFSDDLDKRELVVTQLALEF